MILIVLFSLIFLSFILFILRWIFYPVIISFEKDKIGTLSDQFITSSSSSSSSSDNQTNSNSSNSSNNEFNKRISLPSQYDLSLVIPAYNEVNQIITIITTITLFI